MDPRDKLALHERGTSFVALGAALGVVGMVPYFVLGESEIVGHDPWRNGWVCLALVVWILAVLCILWGIILYARHAISSSRSERSTRRAEADRQFQEIESARKDDERKRQQKEAQEVQSRSWHGRAWNPFTTGAPKVVIELVPPVKGVDTPAGSMATCEVQQSANVFRSRQSTMISSGRTGIFDLVFPDDFESSEGMPPPESVFSAWMPVLFIVTWKSDVLDGPFEHQLSLNRFGRVVQC